MLSGDLASFLANTLQISTGTVLDAGKHLRAAGLLSRKGRGPRSGAKMTEADVVNWLFALVVDRPRGSQIADAVRHARSLTHVKTHQIGLNGFGGFCAPTAGEALETIISGLRTGGAFLAWAGDEPLTIGAGINVRGDSLITNISLPTRETRGEIDVRAGTQIFGPDFQGNQPVTRTVGINTDWFSRVATALGPIQ